MKMKQGNIISWLHSPQQPEGGRRSYYDRHARDVNLRAITSCSENENVIRKLRNNDLKDKELVIKDEDGHDVNDFIIDEDDDIGWLGYFIGKSETLQKLTLYCWPDENERVDAAAFARGIYRNQSIQRFRLHCSEALQGIILFRNNTNLTDLSLYCNIGREVAHSLALALGKMPLKLFRMEDNDLDDDSFAEIIAALSSQTQLEQLHVLFNAIGRRGCEALGNLLVRWRSKNLKELILSNNDIDDVGLRFLIPGISECSNLRWLSLAGNTLVSSAGLRSLFEDAVICNLERLSLNHIMNITEDLVVWGLPNFKSLQHLELVGSSIGDEELQTLSTGITTYFSGHLRVLNLSSNPSITADGLRSLSSLLQSENCSLVVLWLHNHNLGVSDEKASALADVLVGNTSLETLVINDLTSSGWGTFEKLLCDTSSINSTYHSNHTMIQILCSGEVPRPNLHRYNVKRYLEMNKHQDHVAITKILMHHPVFNMKPFFHWKLKFLPVVLAWFEKAMSLLRLEEMGDADGYKLKFGYLVREWLSECDTSKLESADHFSQAVDILLSRILSTVYQFVRAMPLLVVDGYCSQDLTRGSRKRKRILREKMSNGRQRACSF